MKPIFTTIALTAMMLRVACAGGNSNVVQINVDAVLNGRAVATLTDGKMIPLSADVDGAGGLVTQAVAEKLGNPNPHPLPDDGKFAATDRHPEVMLHFSNTDAEYNQIRRSQGEDEFSFAVPEKHYSQMFLFLSSGHFGPAKIQIQLTYQDGATEARDMEVPDWYFPLKPDDADR